MNIINNPKLNQSYINIRPVKVKYNSDDATELYVTIKNDNLVNNCDFYYYLRDAKVNTLAYGVVNFKGTGYTAWTGDNLTPFNYVLNKLNLLIATGNT